MRRSTFLLFAVVFAPNVFANLKVQSADSKTPLLELFTSESCSSCPPADQWFTKLKSSKDLWVKFVPVVFHVDYWNHLNWKDELSSREMTERQRAIAGTWPKPSVYTPGVVLDGKEWQAWRGGSRPDAVEAEKTGVLELNCVGKKCDAQFSSAKKSDDKFIVHIALLGFGIASKVTSGENSGRLLDHAFAVLDWQRQEVNAATKAAFKELKPKKMPSHMQSLVGWSGRIGPSLCKAWADSSLSNEILWHVVPAVLGIGALILVFRAVGLRRLR